MTSFKLIFLMLTITVVPAEEVLPENQCADPHWWPSWCQVFLHLGQGVHEENGAGPGQGLLADVYGHGRGVWALLSWAVGCAESVISLLTNVSISCACVCVPFVPDSERERWTVCTKAALSLSNAAKPYASSSSSHPVIFDWAVECNASCQKAGHNSPRLFMHPWVCVE